MHSGGHPSIEEIVESSDELILGTHHHEPITVHIQLDGAWKINSKTRVLRAGVAWEPEARSAIGSDSL